MVHTYMMATDWVVQHNIGKVNLYIQLRHAGLSTQPLPLGLERAATNGCFMRTMLGTQPRKLNYPCNLHLLSGIKGMKPIKGHQA